MAFGGALGQLDPNLLLSVLGQAIQSTPAPAEQGNPPDPAAKAGAMSAAPQLTPAPAAPSALGTVGDQRQTAPADLSTDPDANPPERFPNGMHVDKYHEQLNDFGAHERQIHYLKSTGVMSPASAEEELAYNDAERARFKLENPWGSPENHPGILGKVGHVLARVGEAALPSLGISPAVIPGSPEQLNMQERGALGRVKEFGTLANAEDATSAKGTEKPELEQAKDASGSPLTTTEGYPVWVDKKNPASQQLVQTPGGMIPMNTYMGATGQQGAAPAATPGTPANVAPAAPNAAPAPSGGALAPVPGQPGALGAVPAPAKGFAPAQPKGTEEEKFVSQYLKDNKLENTATNQQTAHEAFKEGPLLGAPGAKKANDQIVQALAGTGISAGAYTVAATDREPAAKEALKAAQDAAKEDRAQKAPEQSQDRKDARTMGYAVDKDGNLSYMSKTDADKLHSTFEEMKPADVKADRQSIRQLNDVQQNVSRYNNAMNAMKSDIPLLDAQTMAAILSDKGIGAKVEPFGIGLDIGQLNDVVTNTEKAGDWSALKPEEQDLVLSYLRSKSSIIAYNKVLSGSARASEKQLEIEMGQLPLPYVGATVGNKQLGAFQENIERASEGFPVNLPGLKSPAQVKKETEEKAGSAGPKVGDIEDGYKFKGGDKADKANWVKQ